MEREGSIVRLAIKKLEEIQEQNCIQRQPVQKPSLRRRFNSLNQSFENRKEDVTNPPQSPSLIEEKRDEEVNKNEENSQLVERIEESQLEEKVENEEIRKEEELKEEHSTDISQIDSHPQREQSEIKLDDETLCKNENENQNVNIDVDMDLNRTVNINTNENENENEQQNIEVTNEVGIEEDPTNEVSDDNNIFLKEEINQEKSQQKWSTWRRRLRKSVEKLSEIQFSPPVIESEKSTEFQIEDRSTMIETPTIEIPSFSEREPQNEKVTSIPINKSENEEIITEEKTKELSEENKSLEEQFPVIPRTKNNNPSPLSEFDSSLENETAYQALKRATRVFEKVNFNCFF